MAEPLLDPFRLWLLMVGLFGTGLVVGFVLGMLA